MIVKNLFFKQEHRPRKAVEAEEAGVYYRGEENPKFAPWSKSPGANLVTISYRKFKLGKKLQGICKEGMLEYLS